jgi:hypothetical protein
VLARDRRGGSGRGLLGVGAEEEPRGEGVDGAAKPKRSARPATHGMRKKPMAKVTDPQSMSATDAPRSMDAAAAGDIDTDADAPRPGAAG